MVNIWFCNGFYNGFHTMVFMVFMVMVRNHQHFFTRALMVNLFMLSDSWFFMGLMGLGHRWTGESLVKEKITIVVLGKWFISRKISMILDDLGVALFQETSIFSLLI